MPEFIITATAPETVAGRTNTGVGTKMFLTPREAAHDLRLGHLIPAYADAVPVETTPPPRRGRRGGNG